MQLRRYLLSGIAALYFGALIGLTFMQGTQPVRTYWVWSFVLFIPVGLLLTFMFGRRRWWVAVGFGVLGAAWIEAAQVIWMPEGYASVEDLGWASLGVVLGVGLALLATLPHRKSMRSHESHSIVAQAGNREIPQD